MKQLKQSLLIRKLRCRLVNLSFIFKRFLTSSSSTKHVFVTAASAPYFESLHRLVLSIRRYETESILIYDIGLDAAQINMLEQIPQVTVKYFDFDKYPAHFNLQLFPYGSYAWKVALVYDALHSLQCDITYLDARNFVIGKFSVARYYLQQNGYYFPYTSGKVLDWTHPSTCQHFDQHKLVNKTVLNGCYWSFSFSSPLAMSMVEKWMRLALDQQIIAPNGCSRLNHRYDQSVLSCIFHETVDVAGNEPQSTRYYNVLTHYDVFLKKKGK
ncbi:DUF1647 domain-containing protein [Phnomibacter ginsenosidimutans]|uniref:DUF1647 domain-containing protein n=1 Tax=Phnomibacter ginsenosidimutans TaxID=2676868 RepID=A0A6I6H2H8_9BACT|nr:DUF1647 domain-containing protein [Phnomibacter ginsenosidimutans]QGW28791.1 DUF1647 domain-containing protein [Phnomibacter ginsenosidimutans]